MGDLAHRVPNPLGLILQDSHRRGYFDDGLRNAFPPCYDPPPPEMKQLLHRLQDASKES